MLCKFLLKEQGSKFRKRRREQKVSERLRLRQTRLTEQMRAAPMDGSICAGGSFPSGCNSIQHVKDRRKDGMLSCRCSMAAQSPSGSRLQHQWEYLRPANDFNDASILDCQSILMFLWHTCLCLWFCCCHNVSFSACWL